MEIGSIFEIGPELLFKENTKGRMSEVAADRIYGEKMYFSKGCGALEYCLRYIAGFQKGDILLLPAYLCFTILDTLKKTGIEYRLYKTDRNLGIDLEDMQSKLDSHVKAVFFIHYFGFHQSEAVCRYLCRLKEQGIILIEDLTQALFSVRPGCIGIGDIAFASLRKWLPIPDGGVLYAKSKNLPQIEIENAGNDFLFYYFLAQVMKSAYLSDNSLNKQIYLDYADIADKNHLSDTAMRHMSKLSEAILNDYDFDGLMEARISNYEVLYEGLSGVKEIKVLFEPDKACVPLGFPVLCPDRDALRRALIQDNIYCPIHWILPEECRGEDPISASISDSILTIPCDQRYTVKEMKNILRCIYETLRR
jgi:dTDP-4-amino-4,6-dideoxygalactose transaminase